MNKSIQNISMDEPNQSIQIHEGRFQLTQGDHYAEIDGKIYFNWFPHIWVKYQGEVISDLANIIQLTGTNDEFNLVINELPFGNCSLSNISHNEEITVEGTMQSYVVKGDRSIPVTKLNFAIPNLREYVGAIVKTTDEGGGIDINRNRIVFDNENFKIILEKHRDYEKSLKSLKAKGGYIILYSGELTKKSGNIKFIELEDTICCFSTFLSFLNGRRCSPLFIQGVYENNVIWTDYTSYSIDQYIWPQKFSTEGLNEIWMTFSKLWKVDKDFLISAANKISLLLSQLNLNNEVPSSLFNLQSFVDSSTEIVDGVDAFIQIRNAIIHSQEEKRKKLTKISDATKYEALQQSLWYIELSLLYILEFKGKYRNRCSDKIWATENEEEVPWNREN